jgi:hypothetical protein
LHYYHTASHTTPVSRDTAKLLATPPPSIDKTLWLYELCRFLIAQCNSLIVGFLFDTPPCSAATCPEMRAGEWQFLCAVHDQPKSCCAIDYCCHTLDWAANVVTNPKIFPSRFVVDAHDKNTAQKNLVNVFRRLHRIFAHAWFQHRGVFWSLESQSGVYVFFKTVCDVYDLLPAENYKLPPEAEGLDSTSGAGDLGARGTDRRQQQPQQQQHLGPISIAKPPSQREAEDGDYSAMSRTNTRRHIKSSPSTGSAVTTVPEADEDESADLSSRLGEMRISVPAAMAREEAAAELTSIPVVVDHRPIAPGEQPLRPSSVIPPPGTKAGESQLKHVPEPEAAKTEPEAPAPEQSFAPEPEAQPEPETPAKVEEAPAETTEPPAGEEPTPAAEEQEPAPETKEEEPGAYTQDAPSTAPDAQPSAEREPPSVPAAAAAAEDEAEPEPEPTEKVRDAKEEAAVEGKGAQPSSEPETVPSQDADEEKDQEKETEAAEQEPNAEEGSTEKVTSSSEPKVETDDKEEEKETPEKKDEGEAE